MKDIGPLHYFLELEFSHYPREIFLGQGRFTLEILERFQMQDCKPLATLMASNLKPAREDNVDLVDICCIH